MHKTLHGFTLIELMIVVAIFGVLAALAFNQYRAYVARSQFARGVSEAATIKTGVEDCLLNGRLVIGDGLGECNPLVTGSTIFSGAPNLGIIPAGTGAPFVTLDATGTGETTIVAVFGNAASKLISEKSVFWRRSAVGVWVCTSNVDSTYATSGCPADG